MKKVLLCISLALLLCFLIVGLKNPIARYLMRHANFGTACLLQKKHIDHLFIGSSMFRKGISFQGLQEDVYLLGYNGNQPFQIYKTLVYLGQHDVTVRNVYCDMYAYSAVDTPSISDDRIFLDTTIPFQYDLWRETYDQGSGTIGSLYTALVSTNNEILCTWPMSYPIINARYDRGGSLASLTPGINAAQMQPLVVRPITTARLHPRQAYYLQELARYCRAHRINLHFIETPKTQKVANYEAYRTIMRTYTELLQQYPQVHIILSSHTYDNLIQSPSPQIQRLPFEDSTPQYFIDLIHLSGLGRSIFSKELFYILKIA